MGEYRAGSHRAARKEAAASRSTRVALFATAAERIVRAGGPAGRQRREDITISATRSGSGDSRLRSRHQLRPPMCLENFATAAEVRAAHTAGRWRAPQTRCKVHIDQLVTRGDRAPGEEDPEHAPAPAIFAQEDDLSEHSQGHAKHFAFGTEQATTDRPSPRLRPPRRARRRTCA